MRPIRVEYENRTYTVCTVKGNDKEVLVRAAGGTLIARLAPNGGNYETEFKLTDDNQIMSNGKIYGWIDNVSYTKCLSKIIGKAVGEADGQSALTIAKAHNLAKTLESAF